MLKRESTKVNQQISHEGESTHVKIRAYKLIRRLLIGFIFVSIINVTFSNFFYTPKAYSIDAANVATQAKYQLLLGRIEAAENRLAGIAHRDNFVYRSLFGLDTLDTAERSEPYPQSMYSHLDGNQYTPLVKSAWERIDVLAKELYAQSLSFDELQALAKNKEAFSTAIPAIWPIDRTLLRHGIGAFGYRLHPIYKRYIMHKGVDLACNPGSHIYATGDAVVVESDQGLRYSGYGQMLRLKHNFGYETRYAHLSERLVNVGDTVRRGQIIGLSGNTGSSTGPHLHYEVILRGQVVNPLNFFDRNMTKEEYEAMMEQVHETKFEKFDE